MSELTCASVAIYDKSMIHQKCQKAILKKNKCKNCLLPSYLFYIHCFHPGTSFTGNTRQYNLFSTSQIYDWVFQSKAIWVSLKNRFQEQKKTIVSTGIRTLDLLIHITLVWMMLRDHVSLATSVATYYTLGDHGATTTPNQHTQLRLEITQSVKVQKRRQAKASLTAPDCLVRHNIFVGRSVGNCRCRWYHF